jgi:hypothetical protein
MTSSTLSRPEADVLGLEFDFHAWVDDAPKQLARELEAGKFDPKNQPERDQVQSILSGDERYLAAEKVAIEKWRSENPPLRQKLPDQDHKRICAQAAREVAEREKSKIDPFLKGAQIMLDANGAFVVQQPKGKSSMGEVVGLFEEWVSVRSIQKAMAELWIKDGKQRLEPAAELDGYDPFAYGGETKRLTYFDEHGLMAHYPSGGIIQVVGVKNSYKTTLDISLFVAEAMVKDRDLKVLYYAAEQPDSVRRMALDYGTEAGLTEEDIKARFIVHNGVPPLDDPANAEKILGHVERFKPDVVVVDTWQHLLGTTDENSNKASAFLTESGALGQIKKMGKTVVILAHSPLDDPTRGRGHSGVGAAADVIMNLAVNHQKGTLKVTVTHMREAPAGATAHARIPKFNTKLTPEERLNLPSPTVEWVEAKEYNKTLHDPRPDPVETVAQAEPKLSRAEKARARSQQWRAGRRQGVFAEAAE